MHLPSFVRHSSSITKWAAQISPEHFYLELPTFFTYIHTGPLYSHTGYDITSCFHLEVSAARNCRKCHLQWFWVKFLENGLSTDKKICTLIGNNQLQTCWIWRHYLFPVGCNMRYSAKVHKTGAAGKWILHSHPCRTSLQPYQTWRHQLLPVCIYRS